MNIKYTLFLRVLPVFIAFFSVNSIFGQNLRDNLNNWRPEIKTVALLPFKLWVGRSGDKLSAKSSLKQTKRL